MDNFTRKTFTTSRSLTYSYYDLSPAEAFPNNEEQRPAILLLHGFPDDSHLWAQVVPRLAQLPHRFIIPDLLGYGATSKPADAALYASKFLAGDIAELLAGEGISKVIVAGHDWGSFTASRLWLWHPELIAGLALLNVWYQPPIYETFDLPAIVNAQASTHGYSEFSYWEFFTDDSAPALINARLESFWAAMHGTAPDGEWMKEMFCRRNAMQSFVEKDGRAPLHEYAKPGNGWREEWLETFGKGGFAGPLCYYKAYAFNHHHAFEKDLPKDRIKITVPTLFLGCTGDAVCKPEYIEGAKQAGYLPHLTVKVIDSGHWCPMEKPEEVSQILYDFFSKEF